MAIWYVMPVLKIINLWEMGGSSMEGHIYTNTTEKIYGFSSPFSNPIASPQKNLFLNNVPLIYFIFSAFRHLIVFGGQGLWT